MAQNQKSYDNEFKAQAVKLAQEIGGHKAANELGIPKGTMYTWIKGKISFYCKVLHVSRQAFNKYLKTKDAPWKYQALADAMLDICSEDECNDTYGRIRMYQALQFKQPEGVHIPSERTV